MTQTIQQFVARRGITMTAKRADRNPNLPTEPEREMDHWRCTLRWGSYRLTVPFRMGAGYDGEPPKLCAVLDCLASESSGLPHPEISGDVESAFVEWCGEYGYDTDSRAALKTYRACLTQSRRLHRFLGPAAFHALLFETERE